jgi:hypothetical protein
MTLLKLDHRYLNLEHITSIEIHDRRIEVVTPYEVLHLSGPDADKVLRAAARLAVPKLPSCDAEVPW